MADSIDLLTLVEAAALLRIKPATLRAWVLNRQVRFLKLNKGRIFFRRADLVDFVNRSAIEPVGEWVR